MPKKTITIKRLNKVTGLYEEVGRMKNLETKIALELADSITGTAKYVCYIINDVILQEKPDADTF